MERKFLNGKGEQRLRSKHPVRTEILRHDSFRGFLVLLQEVCFVLIDCAL